jgi:hypothetical protein
MKTPILIMLTLVLVSCKKEVQVKLNSKESRLVIEADFSASQKTNTVRITKTGGVTQINQFQTISGAMVVISDGQGYEETLTEEDGGIYHSNSFSGVVGRTYFMTVRYDNKTYEAQSTIQEPVKLQGAFAVNGSWGGAPMQGFMPVYTDVAGTRNYYRFIQYHNGKRLPGSVIRDDRYNDGQPNTEPVLTMDLKLRKGDSLLVELQNIDEANYKYFASKEQTANLESAAPANPISNFSNGALGHFSAHVSQRKSILITE